MSNICHSILEKLTALNIDIYHYEDIVRCYALAKLNIEHSGNPDYTDGIHTAEFTAEIFRYQLLLPDAEPYYDSPAFFSLCSELVSAGMDKDCRLFFEAFAPFLVADWDRLVSIFPKGHHERLAYVVGNKAPDTFSQHYCDYANDLVQYGMVQKLNRRTYNHETGGQNAVQGTSEASTFTRNTTVHFTHKKNHYNALSITLSSTQEMPGSYIDVLIECDHGATGSITVYNTAGKEDIQ